MKLIFPFILLLLTLYGCACKKKDPEPESSGRRFFLFITKPDDHYNTIEADLRNPKGITRDASGNFYISDYDNHYIVKVSADSQVTPLAYIEYPQGLAVDANGNVYVADEENHNIVKITADGTATTFAGSGTAGADNGQGTAASFNHPMGVAIDSHGNLFVTDKLNGLVRKITPGGEVSTFAGPFSGPTGITMDAYNNLYVANSNATILKITPTGEVLNAVRGQPTGDNVFHVPFAITVDEEGNLYVTDIYDWVVRKINVNGEVSVFIGTRRTEEDPSQVVFYREMYGIVYSEAYLYVTMDYGYVLKVEK